MGERLLVGHIPGASGKGRQMTQSTRSGYDRAFAAVCDDLLRMTDMVDQAIGRALDSLQRRDQVLAQQVIADDAQVNKIRFELEEACLVLIATQQPAASDLRAVIAAMNIVTDMERIGDHATGIAKTVIRMGDEPLLKPLIDIPRMAELARQMLRKGVAAFIERDTQAARALAARDDEMDQLYRAVFDELVEIMAVNPAGVTRATYLLWCAHNLERIGDRVTNIAERVIFLTTGNMKELNV
jgi:phosphate transport system protein